MRLKRETIDWQAVSEFYEAGHGREECRLRFGFSDWDWHAAVGREEVRPRTRGQPVLASKRRATIDRLRSEGLSYGAIAERLGVSKSTVAYHARRQGKPVSDRCARRYDWSEVQKAIDAGLTVDQLIERFGFVRASYSKAVSRGALVPHQSVTPIGDLLVAGRARSRGHIKSRLLQAGLKENRCEICRIFDWLGRPLNMELHHINGDGLDNRLENLQLLCGNCHAQTDNWGGRGMSRVKPSSEIGKDAA